MDDTVSPNAPEETLGLKRIDAELASSASKRHRETPQQQHPRNATNMNIMEEAADVSNVAQGEVSQRRPVFIEIFSGSSNLSRWMYEQGFDVVAIDWKHNKHTSKFSAIDADLSSHAGQSLFWQMVVDLEPAAIHAGVACGTSSRAREKAIPLALQKAGAPRPPPLRSAEFPMGLPNLKPNHRQRVEAANVLYKFVLEILLHCCKNNIIFSVENPWRSWFWSVLVHLAREVSLEACRMLNSLHSVLFDNCMHGASRQKRTRIDCTTSVYNELALDCDGLHDHQPYNIQFDGHWRFDTAAEGAYPDVLCQRMAAALSRALPQRVPSRDTSGLRATTTSMNLRQSHRLMQLIPEFIKVFPLDLTLKPLPPLCKNLGPSLEGGVSKGLSKIGMFHSVQQFVNKSLSLKHPLNTLNPVHDIIKTAIFNILTKGTAVVAKHRSDTLSLILSTARELEPAERELRAAMTESQRRILGTKRTLLFRKLLEKSGYDDMGVCDILEKGASLFGTQELPPYADTKVNPATNTLEQLQKEALWRRKALYGKPRDESTFEILKEQTMKEVSLGFLSGPFTEDEVSSVLGTKQWILNPRFLLLQGPSAKPRVIDDCRRSGVNATYTSVEKLSLQDLDYVVTVCKLLRSCRSGGKIKMTLADGSTLQGRLHESIPFDDWYARALDLAKAYKQIAVALDSRHLTVVGFPNGAGVWEHFISDSLPFGAIGSVYGFLRVARAIWFLANSMLWIPTCFYFDDFPRFDVGPLCDTSKKSFECLLNLLGWQFADGEKNLPFAKDFNILGAKIDLAGLSSGTIVVSNKPGRLEHICALIDETVGDHSASRAAVLRGHINFASGFCMGRYLRPATAMLLHVLQRPDQSSGTLTSEAAAKLKELIQQSRPREIACLHEGPPIIVFTDAAHENDAAPLGAIIFDTAGGNPLVFDGLVPQDIVDKWKSKGSKQIISQAELFVVVCIRANLAKLFLRRKVIFFVDNESARFCIIRSVSSKNSMQVLASYFHSIDVELETYHWIERVPSLSNPADLPTRGKTDELLQMFNATYAGKIECPSHLKSQILSSDEEPLAFIDWSDSSYLSPTLSEAASP